MSRWSCGLLCLSLAMVSGSPGPRIDAPAGTFVGTRVHLDNGGQYHQFRGIPYAEPPIGELRFKPTVPKVMKLDGEYDATEFKPFCIQMVPNQDVFGAGQEDCLYLNVYTPTTVERDAANLKKVLVFLHGGGHINGMSDLYEPGELVVNADIIVVTINYRLGILGFMSTFSSASPGNYGLWDDVEALRWVQRNIRAFGGDPKGVTLSGESAGGMDTSYLTLSPESEGLFARAWSMSGTTGVDHTLTAGSTEAAMDISRRVARRENCWAEDAAGPQTDGEWQDVVECLRHVPAERFESLEGLGDMPFISPVIDGDFLPKSIKEMFSDEAYLESIGFQDRDYMVSLCYNEGDFFHVLNDMTKSQMTPEQLESIPENAFLGGLISYLLGNVFGPLSPEVISHVSEFYEENYEVNPVADFGADALFHIPNLEYINALTKSFGSQTSRAHLLRFVNFPEFLTGPYKGTLHAVDLMYVFDFYPDIEIVNKILDYKIDASKWSQADTALKAKYQALIASFVKTGKPSAPKGGDDETMVTWPAYTVEGGHYLAFSEAPSVQQHLKSDRLELFTHAIPRWIEEERERTRQHAEL